LNYAAKAQALNLNKRLLSFASVERVLVSKKVQDRKKVMNHYIFA